VFENGWQGGDTGRRPVALLGGVVQEDDCTCAQAGAHAALDVANPRAG
jgi:hypothetical protein